MDDCRKDDYYELRNIYDSLSFPIVSFNGDLDVIHLNRSALERSEFQSFKEAIRQKCHTLLYRRDTRCPGCPLTSVETPLQQPLEKVITANEYGTTRLLQLRILPIPEEPARFIEIIEDITRKREIEEEAVRKENLAALGTMISGIAHELNNPLTGIGLTLQNLTANLSTMNPDEILKRLNLMHKDMSRAARIVSDILSFTSSNKGKFSQSDIVQVIHRAEANTRRLFPVQAKRIEWQFEGDDSSILPIHPEKIERLFINLFKNSLQAFDYSPGIIRVEIKKTARWTHILIEDNAGGINAENINRIFNPFYTEGNDGSGTGLGLTICHSIVKEHNGRIRVRSFDGITRFHISLPAAPSGEAS